MFLLSGRRPAISSGPSAWRPPGTLGPEPAGGTFFDPPAPRSSSSLLILAPHPRSSSWLLILAPHPRSSSWRRRLQQLRPEGKLGARL
ncbi:hypothetical protein EYF80_066709 [Liparis tanakae]|uniref:Uncharacterized protein n=1 Tax=Liparis tanakae TaxID=230148 RepID=A0A4Z2E372_9TELE|nr:hypothetical protein EYF80_066709 [Liparis tanakae]